MSLRLPSQKKFLVNRAKAGARPGARPAQASTSSQPAAPRASPAQAGQTVNAGNAQDAKASGSQIHLPGSAPDTVDQAYTSAGEIPIPRAPVFIDSSRPSSQYGDDTSATLVNPGTQPNAIETQPPIATLTSQSSTQVDSDIQQTKDLQVISRQSSPEKPISVSKAPDFSQNRPIPLSPAQSSLPLTPRQDVPGKNARIRRPSLIAAAENQEGALNLPSYRGSRASSRASSRPPSRAPSQSPAAALPSSPVLSPAAATSSSPVVTRPFTDLSLVFADEIGNGADGISARQEVLEKQSSRSERVTAPKQKGAIQQSSHPRVTRSTRQPAAAPETQQTPTLRSSPPIDPALRQDPLPTDPPSPTPSQMQDLAQTLVEHEATTAASQPKARAKRKATAKGVNASANGNDAEDEVENVAGPSQPKASKKAAASQSRKRRSDAQSETDEIASVESTPATRLVKPKKQRMLIRRPGFGENTEAYSMLGEEINEETATLKDIVTKHGADGKISARAVVLDRSLRDKEGAAKPLRDAEAQLMHQKKQPLRRKLRAEKNAERERRRAEAIENGEDDGAVSIDEVDTDEDYDIPPDRLTPPSSPEPGAEDQEMDEAAPEDEDAALEEEANQDEEVSEQLFLPEEEDLPPEGQFTEDALPEEDEDAAAFAAAGFTFSANNADADMEDEDIEFDPESMSWEEYERTMERLEATRRRNFDTAQNREVIEEDPEKMINNASFSKKPKIRNDKWTPQETEFFFHVLSEVGENYGLMTHYFPGRNIIQIKKKGVRENKINPARVTAAILARRRIDKDYLVKTVGYDPARPMDREREFIAEARAEQERLKKEDSELLEKTDEHPSEEDVVGEGGMGIYEDAEIPQEEQQDDLGDDKEGDDVENLDEYEGEEMQSEYAGEEAVET